MISVQEIETSHSIQNNDLDERNTALSLVFPTAALPVELSSQLGILCSFNPF